MIHRERILKLSDEPSTHTRGPWKHYPCPSCGGANSHAWPPLGINTETGAVRCLRCGLSGSLRVSEPSRRPQARVDVPQAFSGEHSSALDDWVDYYAKKRGIETDTVWRYGRDDHAGRIVFPAYDQQGELVYFQSRAVHDEGLRYKASGPSARLDHTSILQHGGRLLLVEGPVDAAVVRCRYPVSVACSYTTSPAQSIYDDIWLAHRQGLITGVDVLFDADPNADDAARKLAGRLQHRRGVPARALAWPWGISGCDPASAPAPILDGVILLS